MKLICTICTEYMTSGSDCNISATHCGHVFHCHCLLQWIERSKTCPSCRHKTGEKQIFKLYLGDNNANEDAEMESPEALQNKIQSLKFSLQLKELDMKNVIEENERLSSQTVRLRKDNKKFESTVKEKERFVVLMKQQLKHLNSKEQEAEVATNKLKDLKKEIATLKNVKTIVSGCAKDIETLLVEHNTDPQSLSLFCYLLKQQLNQKEQSKTKLRKNFDRQRAEIAQFKVKLFETQRDCRKLHERMNLAEEDIKQYEKEKAKLLENVKALTSTILTPDSDDLRMVMESPAPQLAKKPRLALMETFGNKQKPISDSPYLQVKSSSFGLRGLSNAGILHKHAPLKLNQKLRNYEIFKKGDETTTTINFGASSSKMQYDGLGGHGKTIEFVSPRPRMTLPPMKRKGISVRSLKSMQTNLNNGNTLDSFIFSD